MQPSTYDVSIGGKRFGLWEYRPELPDTLLLLHGFRGNHHGLHRLATALDGYRVIVPDLPGYGESETLEGRHDFPGYSAWLRALVGKLNLQQYTLAGHSYGASLAVVAAAEHLPGMDRCILVEPVVNAATWTGRLGKYYYQTATHLPPLVRRWWIANALFNRLTTELLTSTRDPVVKRRIVKDEQANMPYVVVRVEVESYLGFYQIHFPQAAKSISVPTLLLAGDRDQMTPVAILQQLAQQPPQCEFRMLSEAGHFAPMEIPETVASAMLTWLNRR